MPLFTARVPHTSPEGLRLHSIAAPPEHTQQSAFAPGSNTRIGLHSQSDEAQHLPRTALQPWRASFVQQVLSPVGARQQAASAAGCLLCSKSAAAFAALHCQGPHTSPEGLRLHNIAAPPEHSQQSAFAPGCNTRSGLHSQSDEAQHLPCTALQPWRASFVQQVLSPAGARQQAASAAGCLLCSKTGSTYRSAFPGAALRPAGSICAAMLSLNNATARIRAQLINSHRPAVAVR